MRKAMLFSLVFLLAPLFSPAVQAAQYVYLDPGFTLNFGSTGKIRYLRTEIALKVDSEEAAALVTRHKRYLRSDLILLIGAQEPEIINSPKGRETLRQVALDNLRARMTQLEDEPLIEALYFSNFVTQN